ncbi:hypothetical protein OG321_38935 [Streptomyces sp. NBC_00424]|nr:hypothetical protein [Streptomyces sp. NBC_00424]MCX5078421.1 hypothetical protein [Streptomyces sp. NBC_00424]
MNGRAQPATFAIGACRQQLGQPVTAMIIAVMIITAAQHDQ